MTDPDQIQSHRRGRGAPILLIALGAVAAANGAAWLYFRNRQPKVDQRTRERLRRRTRA